MANTFYKRPGTTDKGKDYEDLMVANLVLQLLTDNNITNFKISSNDENFGAFDDVVLEIEQNNHKSEEKYALQLKHVNKGKPFSVEALTKDSGNYSIKKYFKSFQQFKKSCAGFKLILITNLKLDITNSTLIDLVDGESFQVEIIKCSAVPLLNTSSDVQHCYTFRLVENTKPSKTTDNYKDFFEHFYLYADQSSVDQLKIHTSAFLVETFFCDDSIAENFFQFITEWSIREGTKEKLNKEMMQKVITLHVLSPQLYPITFHDVNDNMKSLREAISLFDVTLFDSCFSGKVQNLWGDFKNELKDPKELNQLRKSYQICKNNIQDINKLSDEECSKFLWLMNKCPLIVPKNKSVLKILDLCKDQKFVLLGENSMELEQFSTFRKLSDLEQHVVLFEKIVRNFKCSIQDSRVINLEELIHHNSTIKEIISIDDLLKMINQPVLIGEEKEVLPVAYVSRLFSRNVFSKHYLEEADQSRLILVSICSETALEENLYIWLNTVVRNSNVHVYTDEVIEEIVENMKDQTTVLKFHHLKLLQDGNLEWIRSNTEVFDLEPYHLGDTYMKEELFQKQKNKINIVTGLPGIGKSSFFKCLKNNLCSNVWTVLFSSQEISSLCLRLDEMCNEEEFARYVLDTKYSFLDIFGKTYLNLLIQRGEIIYLWDALDEISRYSLRKIVVLIRKLSGKSTLQWVACRHYLKDVLENEFKVFSRKLIPFDAAQTFLFINKQLDHIHGQHSLEGVITKVKKIISGIDDGGFLSFPLHIQILLELIYEKYTINSTDVISEQELFYNLIKQKFNVYYREKANVKSSNRVLTRVIEQEKKTRIKNYEKAALSSLIDKKYMKQWNITCDDFLEEIKTNNDPVGFITEIRNGKPFFIHKTYAEYFAAGYLFARYETLSKFEKFYFDRKYTNIRHFFDLFLARDSPAHVAVLHEDFDTLRKCEESLSRRDSGGRSVLHLACSWGAKYPNVKVVKHFDHYVLDDAIFKDCRSECESLEYLKIVRYLLERDHRFEKDELFGLEPISYAKKFNCLCAVALLKRQQNHTFSASSNTCCFPLTVSTFQSSICAIVYVSTVFGNCTHLDFFDDEEINFITRKSDGSSLLHLLVAKKHISGVERLLSLESYQKNINGVDSLGQTALFVACRMGYKEMVYLLVRFGANVNVSDKNGKTPLHVAAECGNFEIVVSLINFGADVDAMDGNQATALSYACHNGHEEIVQYITAL